MNYTINKTLNNEVCKINNDDKKNKKLGYTRCCSFSEHFLFHLSANNLYLMLLRSLFNFVVTDYSINY